MHKLGCLLAQDMYIEKVHVLAGAEEYLQYPVAVAEDPPACIGFMGAMPHNNCTLLRLRASSVSPTTPFGSGVDPVGEHLKDMRPMPDFQSVSHYDARVLYPIDAGAREPITSSAG
jgi:hypothetical protein